MSLTENMHIRRVKQNGRCPPPFPNEMWDVLSRKTGGLRGIEQRKRHDNVQHKTFWESAPHDREIHKAHSERAHSASLIQIGSGREITARLKQYETANA